MANIWKAAWDGDEAAVRDLVVRGVDPDEREPSTGCSPLHYAASAGRVSTIEFLLRQAVDVNARNRLGRTPLHLAAIAAASRPADDAAPAEAQQLLLATGADPEVRDDLGHRPADYAQGPVAEAQGKSSAATVEYPAMCYIAAPLDGLKPGTTD